MSGTKFDVDVIAAGEGEVLAYADGAVIFRRGEDGECAYIIKSGNVEIREKSRAVEVMEFGEIFGEMALIDDEPRTATAVAVGTVELIPIDRRMFGFLIRDDTDFARIVMLLMARRLRAAMNMLERCVEALPAAAEPVRHAARATA
jgi:CRP-like cAMP-binding protein